MPELINGWGNHGLAFIGQSPAICPTRGHIRGRQGVEILSFGGIATMSDQVNLQKASSFVFPGRIGLDRNRFLEQRARFGG